MTGPQATLTHVCRHDSRLKTSPGACGLRRARARNVPQDTTADDRLRLERCLDCEGPLPLEKPEHVKTEGPGPRHERARRGAAPAESKGAKPVPASPKAEKGAHQEHPRGRAGVPDLRGAGRAAAAEKPGPDAGQAGGEPAGKVQPAERRRGGKKKRRACDPARQPAKGKGRKLSRRRQLTQALARMLEDRNRELRKARRLGQPEKMELAAKDVYDMARLMAINEKG